MFPLPTIPKLTPFTGIAFLTEDEEAAVPGMGTMVSGSVYHEYVFTLGNMIDGNHIQSGSVYHDVRLTIV